jgi:kynurenine formamidase
MGENPDYGPVSFANEYLVLSGHTGTHLDASLHSDPLGESVESIPLEECVGQATKLDLRALCGPRALITAANLVDAINDAEPASILLLDSGWSRRFATDPEDYFRNSPGLDAGAATWIRSKGVRCVGIDAPSIDAPNILGAPAHMNFSRGRPPIHVIENLCNLDALPASVPFFAAAPLPILGASGSPVRAFAVLDR